ncbi:cAMP-binding domain of CRP or a regulatory subunit of cAMP-dependent protein kinases [Pedobacter westerhofensis]|uniref:cAMP-binding domain of CRP or a regulatory subunit of cAMP-dependent protein kinases n=1 Tax=Pedobacter westerhofensis TaxID=425512 RepID=A0A521ADY3_9SPHI|nr:Crp/Fnr family transcriptional regulator [Pedobacter westerhofensis]SMO32991.1 cAMP-binding domain of CRP or a regulatory subunit of cAMP-dependent protein kinases [Pedobacter westerhofensis]
MPKISIDLYKNLESAVIKAGLTIDHVNSLSESIKPKVIPKHEFLITEGAVCNFFGIVLKGSFRCFVTNDLEEFNNDFFFEGDFITALTSYLVSRPTSFNIQALTDTAVFLISEQQFQRMIKDDPRWLLLRTYITETFFIRKCRREISFLKQSAAQRLDTLSLSFPGIEQKVSQYHIASYLGIRPESLSRIKLASNNSK